MAGYIGANTSSVNNNQNAAERRKKFTFTANTTVLSGLNFAPEKIHIFHNGIRLVRTTDYTEAADGKSVTLVNAAQAGDEVVAVTFAQDPASNAGYTDADVDAHLLTAGVTLDATNDRVGFGSTSPAKKIHIDESVAAGEGILLTNSNNVAGTYSDLKWQYSGVDPSYGSGLRFRQVDTTHGGQLEFYTDSSTGTYTKQMQITEDGHVTTPNQPAFNAYRTSTQSISGTTTLVFNSVRSNASNSYNSSNGIFTAPVAGQYILTFKALFYPFDTSEYLDLYSYVNSSIRNRYEQTGNGGGHTQIDYTEVVYLNANDTFKMVATDRNTGSFGMYANENHFSGRLLG